MEENTLTRKKPDRLLGDEWEDWDGRLDESGEYDEPARLFVMAAAFAVLILAGTLGAVLYLIEPRLALLHPLLVVIARTLTVLATLAIFAFTILVVIGSLTGRNLFFGARLGQLAASRVLPLAESVARRLGVSRDRLGNSFVAFSNAIVRAGRAPRGKTIILLPRCLAADQRKLITELGERTGVGVFTATGGGQARRIILTERPAAVIGVACERDLVSGIHDVAPKLPTIGIPNKRPEGPCKNTLVDLDEVRRAIRTLTGKAAD